MKRMPSLDGLRAVSLLMVILSHFFTHAQGHNSVEVILLRIAYYSRSGISVFFVLSGFLITLLLMKEKEANGQISLSGFYRRRALRILPAFLVYIGCLAILVRFGVLSIPRWLFVRALTFTMDYVSLENWFIHHTCTVSVEVQFYLVWPMIVYFCSRKWLTRIALSVIVLEPFVRLADRIFLPSTRYQINYMAHTRADMLMFGCLLALLYENAAFQRIAAAAFRRQAPLAAAIFFFLISPLLEMRSEGHYLLSMGYTLQGICIVILVVFVMERADGVVGRFLNAPAVVWLGMLSYSMYLWQELFIGVGSTMRSLIGLPIALAVAAVSYYLVERPMLRVKDRFEPRRTRLDPPPNEPVTLRMQPGARDDLHTKGRIEFDLLG